MRTHIGDRHNPTIYHFIFPIPNGDPVVITFLKAPFKESSGKASISNLGNVSKAISATDDSPAHGETFVGVFKGKT